MPTPIIIGAGSGLVSAALFASAAMATSFLLLLLAPLPICLAGLGWGSRAALVSAIAGALVIALSLGPLVATIYGLVIAAPLAVLTHLVLLSQPAPTPGNGVGAVEWYPTGRLVAWAALIAGALAAVFILIFGYDQESYRELIRQMFQQDAFKELDQDGTLFTEENIDRLASVFTWVFPGFLAIVWLTISLFNLWLAGRIVDASGRALRPWPDLHALELPNFLVLLFAGAIVLSFIPGLPGLLATGLAGALLFAYVLQGLAVIHVYSKGMPARGLLLATVYLGILLLGWVAILVAILGLAEPMLGLRQRSGPSGSDQPPTGSGTT